MPWLVQTPPNDPVTGVQAAGAVHDMAVGALHTPLVHVHVAEPVVGDVTSDSVLDEPDANEAPEPV